MFLKAGWFNFYPWFLYDDVMDVAFCFTCIKAFVRNKIIKKYIVEHTFFVNHCRDSNEYIFIRKDPRDSNHVLEKTRVWKQSYAYHSRLPTVSKNSKRANCISADQLLTLPIVKNEKKKKNPEKR